ncbi:Adenosine monophosphate-protein transferase FICD-like protein [Armadillidium vulgare]|nr:Adenosine monophosphate-protein transferase FICD-like protein [Armadillidium vulgare]
MSVFNVNFKSGSRIFFVTFFNSLMRPLDIKDFLNYVQLSKCLPGPQFKEMNKCTLCLVFICGVVFSGLFSLLKTSVTLDPILTKFYPTGIGILPPETDLDLMDDGYIQMAQLSYYEYDEDIRNYKRLKLKTKETELEERSSELEALNSLKAAIELTSIGKTARVGRLLEHAHSLAPNHHDVLLMYGEYLELSRSDIIQADHLFLKALTISPQSSRASRNRRRTKVLVEKLDESTLLRIDNKRDELMLIPSLSGALKRVKREAYFQHIYHTAAIEGNTLTLAQIRMILETGLSVEGKSIMEHNEILGIDLALKYINTTLVHRIGKITLRDILEIHRRVLGHVDPIGAGNMRTTQVFVSDHVPPPPSKLELLMEDFLSWLNSDEAEKLHPIKYAALAHYKFVFIHPFVDGNGRTARLLMNFLLMQAGYPPVIIRKQDRLHYYDTLQLANDGDTRPFIRFVARCMENTLDVYLWATREHLPELEQATPHPDFVKNEQAAFSASKLNAISFLIDVKSDVSPRPINSDFTVDESTLNAPRSFHFQKDEVTLIENENLEGELNAGNGREIPSRFLNYFGDNIDKKTHKMINSNKENIMKDKASSKSNLLAGKNIE